MTILFSPSQAPAILAFIILFYNRRKGGHIVFGADLVCIGRLRSFFSVPYLLNQLMDIDQTCTIHCWKRGSED